MDITTYLILLNGLYREFINQGCNVDKAIAVYTSKSSVHGRRLPAEAYEFMKQSVLKIYEEVKNESQEPSDAMIWDIGTKLFNKRCNN